MKCSYATGNLTMGGSTVVRKQKSCSRADVHFLSSVCCVLPANSGTFTKLDMTMQAMTAMAFDPLGLGCPRWFNDMI